VLGESQTPNSKPAAGLTRARPVVVLFEC